MWVQVWGLLFDLINEEAGLDIGRGIGSVVEVDYRALASDQARFLRIRVEVLLDQLIRRGNLISVPISYGLDKEEINEGHVTRHTPTDTSRSFTWDTGTNGNNIQTLPAGDKNTKFFHQQASQRRRKNTIEGLHDTSREWCTDIGEIAGIAEGYYKRLFTASSNLNMDYVLASVDKVVTGDMVRDLVHPYMAEEVKTALFQMHPSKAPRPDDMSPFFFQKFWHIVGQDVTEAVLSVLHSGRYFPTCFFMEAELGSNPSFVWRSLLSARDVIREGSIWSIGDGCTAGIKSHRWLPHPPTFHDGVDTTMKVREFINPHTKQWDRSKVNAWFLPSSRDEVLQIRLGSLDSRDKLVWNENKSQTFSGLPIPSKVRNFVWRASSDILPTRANLAQRKVHMDPKFCGVHDEIVIHILWQCPLACNVWVLVQGKLQKCDSSALDFLSLAWTLVEKLSREELETWAMVAWSIWNARSRLQFEAAQTPPQIILKGAVSLLEEYQRLASSRSCS
ncbi:hypothetical protein SO802_022781 [Lithocarpus litseifolius]|uniref:Reverse transcriptase zinc-binding domain-containing protein n=1 Tax=Lithocarpus litseifolius TaxID=425828 RepID=A0AAW2C6A1_9ROSI